MIPSKGDSLKFTSVTDNLRLVERLVDDVCSVYNVNEDSYGNMMIALTEAVNNAITHGNQNNPNKFVNIGFENNNNQLIFKISDEGDGFNFSNLPDPTDPENIDKPNGRGVFLMKNLADSMEFMMNGKMVVLAFNN